MHFSSLRYLSSLRHTALAAAILIPHNVVAEDGAFRSPGMDARGTFSHQFTKAGTYTYVCGIHPFMKATVVVR
ncbi:amicyanin-alpha [Mycobacteroides abscessus subsp. abscessus]|nr:amicyanin-alpha [Mycobacteroides abscessus subsp. abscessus]